MARLSALSEFWDHCLGIIESLIAETRYGHGITFYRGDEKLRYDEYMNFIKYVMIVYMLLTYDIM